MEIKTEFKGKELIIYSKENYMFDGIKAVAVEKLQPELHEEIIKVVIYNIDNEEKIREEKKKKEEEDEYNANMLAYNEWIKEVEKEFDISDMKFFPPQIKSYNYNPKQISIGDVDIFYDPTIFRRGCWSSSRTDRCWVMKADFKTHRYTKLEKAITKAREKNKEIKEERERIKNKEMKKQTVEEIMKQYAEENGFVFEKDWQRSNRTRYTGEGWYKYYMKKGVVKARITFSEEKNSVVILNYKVSRKDGISLDELKNVKGE